MEKLALEMPTLAEDCDYDEYEDDTCEEVDEDDGVMSGLVVRGGTITLYDIWQMLGAPLYCIDKRKSKIPLKYTSPNKQTTIYIKPGAEGRPNVYDKDLIIYTISHIQKMYKDKQITAETANFAVAFDYKEAMALFGRPLDKLSKGCTNYIKLDNAGDRLMMSKITVASKRNNIDNVNSQPFVCQWNIQINNTTKQVILEIKLADWIYNAVLAGPKRNILSLDPEYFRIPIGMTKRLYEVIRKNAGIGKSKTHKAKERWSCSFEKLALLCGSDANPKNFAEAVRKSVREIAAINAEYEEKAKNAEKGEIVALSPFRHWHIYCEGNCLVAINLARVKEGKTDRAQIYASAQKLKNNPGTSLNDMSPRQIVQVEKAVLNIRRSEMAGNGRIGVEKAIQGIRKTSRVAGKK
jgi:hypothetical protein